MDFEIRSLPGLTRFSDVHALQKQLLDQRIADEIPDTLIFCEHHPVITRGRGLQFRADRTERARPLPVTPPGTDYVEIERGGDLTWHGPGQLVVYPIVKLGGNGSIGRKVGQDIDAWVRFQEHVWASVIEPFGLRAFTKPGGSGVWLHDHGLDRKWVSVGIALRKWVSYHGTAGNILNDPMAFAGFDPCGFQSEVMIRALDLPPVPRDWFGPDWRARWEEAIRSSFARLT
jgi:lipoyl(octanoyl) transferase